MDENNEPNITGIVAELIPNMHIIILVHGKVIDKQYIKKAKCFAFRIQTDKEFDIDFNNKRTEQIFYQFIISKKMHRKYRNVICDGNYIEVYGLLRQHDIYMDKENISNRLVLEVQSALECQRETIPDGPDVSKIPNSPEVKKLI
jgi:hypothetical protein